MMKTALRTRQGGSAREPREENFNSQVSENCPVGPWPQFQFRNRIRIGFDERAKSESPSGCKLTTASSGRNKKTQTHHERTLPKRTREGMNFTRKFQTQTLPFKNHSSTVAAMRLDKWKPLAPNPFVAWGLIRGERVRSPQKLSKARGCQQNLPARSVTKRC